MILLHQLQMRLKEQGKFFFTTGLFIVFSTNIAAQNNCFKLKKGSSISWTLERDTLNNIVDNALFVNVWKSGGKVNFKNFAIKEISLRWKVLKASYKTVPREEILLTAFYQLGLTTKKAVKKFSKDKIVIKYPIKKIKLLQFFS